MSARHLASILAVALSVLALGCGGDASDAAASGTSEASPAAESEGASADGGTETAENASASGLIDPNDASPDELSSLPHVDASLADAVIAGRPYADMLQVDAVLADRLSEEEREAVYGRLFKPLDLNAATGQEILLIPGVGERMEHEFEEYRPYRGMEEFRREIGKYVDEAEVSRLEQYVTLQ